MDLRIQSLLSQTSLASLDAELLLAYVLKQPRSFVVAHPEYTLTFFQYLRFQCAQKKRLAGIPLAHITKQKNFFGLSFFVNRHTLVPRPDTEMLVERVLADAGNRNQEIGMRTVLDIGTGSGCIAVSLAKHLGDHASVFASDVSRKALTVARRNAKAHDVSIDFRSGSLLFPFYKELKGQEGLLLIVANLPYLTEKQFTEEPSIQHEPKLALVADDHGLALYYYLIDQCVGLDRSLRLYMEIDPTQTDRLLKYIKTRWADISTEVVKDLAGHDRVVILEIKIPE